MILDVNGQPIDVSALAEPQSARVVYLHREFDNHPARGLTPQRLHSILVQAEQGNLVAQLELADDMCERDAHLYAELSKRRGAITSQTWSVEPPPNPSAAEKAMTERVAYWLGAIQCFADGMQGGLELVISTMTDALLKGFAPIEMVWALQPDGSGAKVQLPTLTQQPQRWFTPSADRRRLLLRSQTESTPASDYLPSVMGVELLPYAWLMHLHPARSGYVSRMSLARVLAWPYLFKNYSVRDLAEFLEIYGLPTRIGKYPAGASPDEKRTLLRAVTDIGHNAAGIIPQGMVIDFLAAADGTDGPFAAMWDRMDAAESKAILGQTLTAEQGQRGSQALGRVHEKVRMDIRDADARLIEATLSRQLIQPLVALNIAGADLRRLPRLVLDTGDAEDLTAYADALPKLVGIGLPIGVSWAQDKLRIPAPQAGEAVLSAPAAPAPPPVGAAGAGGAAGAADAAQAFVAAFNQRAAALAAQARAAAAPAVQPEPDAIDALVAEQVAQWQPLLTPLVGPLLAELDKAVAAGESLQAFAARLPQLVARMDAGPLAEDLARAGFGARLAGEADLDLTGQDA
jgi:phage gp29-like protein